MREIKFRGYSHEHESWIYGDLLQYPDGEVYIMEHSDGESLSYRVEPKSVGQYTGLKDKAHKDIYEGDILIDEDFDYPLKMVWFDGCFKLHGKGLHLPDVIPAYERLQLRDLRIIGNIHDNPIEGID